MLSAADCTIQSTNYSWSETSLQMFHIGQGNNRMPVTTIKHPRKKCKTTKNGEHADGSLRGCKHHKIDTHDQMWTWTADRIMSSFRTILTRLGLKAFHTARGEHLINAFAYRGCGSERLGNPRSGKRLGSQTPAVARRACNRHSEIVLPWSCW